jgi:hypothetical protein
VDETWGHNANQGVGVLYKLALGLKRRLVLDGSGEFVMTFRFSKIFSQPRVPRHVAYLPKQVHQLVQVVCRWPEPNQDTFGSAVNVAHQSNLVALFRIIVLVDADLINPQDESQLGVW